ncbi:MAG: ROK family protein [Clostridia bacterium]|nr:ROK family protein [Clostridia bacterium]
MSAAKYIGIDLGGTKIAGVLADAGGTVLHRETIPTRTEEGQDKVIARISGLIRTLLAAAGAGEVKGIGLCTPGPSDLKAGVVIEAPNLKWKDLPIVALLEKEFDLPVVLENDANAAAYGEYVYGAAEGRKDLVYLTVSTGIGGGIIINGEIVYGRDFSAGEVGHMIVLPDGPPCGCGRRGCVEALASGSAIAREAKALLLKEGQDGPGRAGLLWELTGGDPERLTAKEVGEAAAQGDPLALSVLEKAFRYLGIALGNLVNLLNPEIIVIGGGVAAMGPLLFRPAIRAMEATAFAHMCRDLPVVPALLGGEAGTKGMVALARRKIQG